MIIGWEGPIFEREQRPHLRLPQISCFQSLAAFVRKKLKTMGFRVKTLIALEFGWLFLFSILDEFWNIPRTPFPLTLRNDKVSGNHKQDKRHPFVEIAE